MNNYITWESLKCPPKPLECILEQLICNLQCKPETSFTGSFSAGVLILTVNGVSASITLPDLDNQTLSLSGNILTISNGNTIDLTPFANIAESVTTITNTVIGNKIATYTNELGIAVDINETITFLGTPTLGPGNILSIPFVNENSVTQTVTVDLSSLVTLDVHLDTVIYDAVSNIITLTETDGNIHTINLSEFSIIATTNPDGSITVTQEGVTKFTIPAPQSDIITTFVENPDFTLTYTNEAGLPITTSVPIVATDCVSDTATVIIYDGGVKKSATIRQIANSEKIVTGAGLTVADQTQIFSTGGTVILPNALCQEVTISTTPCDASPTIVSAVKIDDLTTYTMPTGGYASATFMWDGTGYRITKNYFKPTLSLISIPVTNAIAQDIQLNQQNGVIYNINWGDGSSTLNIADNAAAGHDYTTPFTGNITITSLCTINPKEFLAYPSSFISENISNLPAGLTYYNNQGQNTTYGDIGSLPTGLTYYSNTGQNTTNGDISNLPIGITYYINEGLNQVNSYTPGRVWASNMNRFHHFPAVGFGLSSTMVDNLLIDLAATTWLPGSTLFLGGNNSPRTTASDIAVSTLNSLGVTVLTN